MKKLCAITDFPLKSYFLAPHSENKKIVQELINNSLHELFQWRENSFKNDSRVIPQKEKLHPNYKKNISLIKNELSILQKMFQKEIPRHSPRYMAHMFSDYSIPALLGHFLGLLYNPNNISSESSFVGSKIEKMAIDVLAKMIHYPPSAIGHFTSGGTVANLEMLYRFKKTLDQNKSYAIFVPATAHYSWQKGFDLIGIDPDAIVSIETDKNGSVDVFSFEKKLKISLQKNIRQIAVISVLGTTEFGSIDPIYDIAKLIQKYKNKNTYFWHHIDAAYGGFYATIKKPTVVSTSFLKNVAAIQLSDSITIDPHKLGYVPYSSGCFICRNKTFYRAINNSAAYVDFKSKKEPGPYTIEGSRSAAGAIATLLTARTLGFNSSGLGRIIEKTIEAAQQIRRDLSQNQTIHVLKLENSNILCFFILSKDRKLSHCNKLTKHLHKKISTNNNHKTKNKFYVSKTILNSKYKRMVSSVCQEARIQKNVDELFLIRCTIMNPFINSKYYKKSLIKEFVAYLDDSINNLSKSSE